MYEFIRGKKIYSTLEEVVLDVNGVGYLIAVPSSTLAKLPLEGEEVTLYTAFVVREQLQALYGFLSREERDLFTLLGGVSGIGPKTALGIVGHFSIAKLQAVLASQDASALAKVPGIGKKMAQRLLLELGGKLLGSAKKAGASPLLKKGEDAISTLLNLGYSQSLSEKAVQQALVKVGDKADLSTLITEALKGASSC